MDDFLTEAQKKKFMMLGFDDSSFWMSEGRLCEEIQEFACDQELEMTKYFATLKALKYPPKGTVDLALDAAIARMNLARRKVQASPKSCPKTPAPLKAQAPPRSCPKTQVPLKAQAPPKSCPKTPAPLKSQAPVSPKREKYNVASVEIMQRVHRKLSRLVDKACIENFLKENLAEKNISKMIPLFQDYIRIELERSFVLETKERSSIRKSVRHGIKNMCK